MFRVNDRHNNGQKCWSWKQGCEPCHFKKWCKRRWKRSLAFFQEETGPSSIRTPRAAFVGFEKWRQLSKQSSGTMVSGFRNKTDHPLHFAKLCYLPFRNQGFCSQQNFCTDENFFKYARLPSVEALSTTKPPLQYCLEAFLYAAQALLRNILRYSLLWLLKVQTGFLAVKVTDFILFSLHLTASSCNASFIYQLFVSGR